MADDRTIHAKVDEHESKLEHVWRALFGDKTVAEVADATAPDTQETEVKE